MAISSDAHLTATLLAKQRTVMLCRSLSRRAPEPLQKVGLHGELSDQIPTLKISTQT